MKEVLMEIPDDVIQAQVRAAVARSLSAENPEKLIQAIVDVALKEQRYGDSVWEKAVNKMIQEIANEIFKKWIEEHRAGIEQALATALNRQKKGLTKALVDGLLQNASAYRKIAVTFAIVDRQ